MIPSWMARLFVSLPKLVIAAAIVWIVSSATVISPLAAAGWLVVSVILWDDRKNDIIPITLSIALFAIAYWWFSQPGVV